MAKKNRYGLTARQELYCNSRVAGDTQRDAYRAAGYQPNASDKTADEAACRLESLPQIKARLQHLQDIANQGALMTSDQRKAALLEFWQDDSKSDKDRLKALDMLNRMSGDYIDKRETSVTVQGLTRDDRKQAMQDTLDALKSVWERLDGTE